MSAPAPASTAGISGPSCQLTAHAPLTKKEDKIPVEGQAASEDGKDGDWEDLEDNHDSVDSEEDAGGAAKADTGATEATSPSCGLPGCEIKVTKGGLCSQCRSVNYCSKEHQRSDWPSHKSTCRTAKKQPKQPVSRLDEIQNPLAWSVGLGPKKQREWLVDCYRMRLDDDYAVGGDVRGGSLYDQSEPDEIIQDFLVFCRLAEEQGALPVNWNWPKFLDTAAELLPYAFEKSDAHEKYGGENVFASFTGGRSLRFTGELIYGSSISSFAEESNEHKRLMRQLKYKKRTSKMVEKVGGKNAWDSLEWKLWRSMPDAQPMAGY